MWNRSDMVITLDITDTAAVCPLAMAHRYRPSRRPIRISFAAGENAEQQDITPSDPKQTEARG
jgi:hypothetical protein